MKRAYWLLAFIAILTILPGCTSNSRYQKALDDNVVLTTQVTDLNAQITTLKTQIDQFSKVYPPRDFATLAELTAWLAKDKTNELPTAASFEELYSRGLAQQLAALRDGYIISVDQDYRFENFFFVMGAAIVNGNIWIWDVDTDTPRQPIGFDKVSRGP
jgi:outer membrane murein-binding lipoprotein Lpp